MQNIKNMISIVIPTRNRAETLEQSLKTVLSQSDPNFEVIVSDNSTDDLTYDLIKRFSDHRIVYTRTPKLLSMTDNWNYAYKAVSGDYVMYIGDDDGICTDGVKTLRDAIKAFPACAYKWNTTEYQWPIDDKPSKIISLASHPRAAKVYSLMSHAKFVMRFGGWLYYRLPGVYHASVARSVLDSIARLNNGRLFTTTQPDLFTAMAVPQFCDKYVRLPRSVSIQGRSAKSNGGSSTAANGEEHMQEYIKEYGSYQVPEIFVDLPFNMGWFMEPFYAAQSRFSVYGKLMFNYSAMWAFAVRIGFITHEYVRDNYRSFNPNMNFSYVSYLLFHTLHSFAQLRRAHLNRELESDSRPSPPNDIYSFSKYLETVERDA